MSAINNYPVGTPGPAGAAGAQGGYAGTVQLVSGKWCALAPPGVTSDNTSNWNGSAFTGGGPYPFRAVNSNSRGVIAAPFVAANTATLTKIWMHQVKYYDAGNFFFQFYEVSGGELSAKVGSAITVATTTNHNTAFTQTCSVPFEAGKCYTYVFDNGHTDGASLHAFVVTAGSVSGTWEITANSAVVAESGGVPAVNAGSQIGYLALTGTAGSVFPTSVTIPDSAAGGPNTHYPMLYGKV